MSGKDDAPRSRTDSLFIGGEAKATPPPPAATPVRSATPSGRAAARPPSGHVASVGRPTPRRVIASPEETGVVRNDSARLITIIALCVGALGLISLLFLMSGRRTVTIQPPPVVSPTSPTPPAITPPGVTSTTAIAPPVRPAANASTATLNLMPNPSVEDLVGGQPAPWRQVTYNGNPIYSIGTQARRGKQSLCISSQDGADASWQVVLTVKPRTSYLFKGWIRTENIAGNAKGALFNLHPTDIQSNAVTGTSSTWKQASFQFDSGDRTTVEINCLYGGWGRSTGTAWYDDFELIELFSSK